MVTDRPALIIVGGYRCGTTSLHSYLAGHPQISPSVIKEPAYFFSLRRAERPPVYPVGHEAACYLSLFGRRPQGLLLESTSNYLTDPGCATRIAQGLPGARIVIALRDPVARLRSWYQFLRLQGFMDRSLDFRTWIERQLSDRRPLHERAYDEQALAHGHHAGYVAEYLRVFGHERVHLVWFDHLAADPRGTLQALARFAGIDPDYYNDFAFPTRNPAMKIDRPRAFRIYRRLVEGTLSVFRLAPRVNFRVRATYFGRIEPRLLGLFTGPANPVTVPDDLVAKLRAHYTSDLKALERVTGTAPPWGARWTEQLP